MFPYDEYAMVSICSTSYINAEYKHFWLNWTALERAFDKHELKIIWTKRIKLKAVRALT